MPLGINNNPFQDKNSDMLDNGINQKLRQEATAGSTNKNRPSTVGAYNGNNFIRSGVGNFSRGR